MSLEDLGWKASDSNVPKTFEPYPVKRKKLAAAIHDIQDLMDKGQWRWWSSWEKWDFMRLPITYCFECLYPVRLIPKVSPSGKLLSLQCNLCELMHFDAKYD